MKWGLSKGADPRVPGTQCMGVLLDKGKKIAAIHGSARWLEGYKLGSPKARWFASTARQKLGNDQARTSLVAAAHQPILLY